MVRTGEPRARPEGRGMAGGLRTRFSPQPLWHDSAGLPAHVSVTLQWPPPCLCYASVTPPPAMGVSADSTPPAPPAPPPRPRRHVPLPLPGVPPRRPLLTKSACPTLKRPFLLPSFLFFNPFRGTVAPLAVGSAWRAFTQLLSLARGRPPTAARARGGRDRGRRLSELEAGRRVPDCTLGKGPPTKRQRGFAEKGGRERRRGV